jgi:hypothetical protein
MFFYLFERFLLEPGFKRRVTPPSFDPPERFVKTTRARRIHWNSYLSGSVRTSAVCLCRGGPVDIYIYDIRKYLL